MAHGLQASRYSISWPGPVVAEALTAGATVRYTLAPDGSRATVSKICVESESEISAEMVGVIDPRSALRWVDQQLRSVGSLSAFAAAAKADGVEAEWRELLTYAEELRVLWRGWEEAAARVINALRDSASVDRRLLVVAATYARALELGARAPNKIVAAYMGCSLEKVREDLRAARSSGLLSAAPGRGQPGGQLTKKALDMIREDTP